MFTLESVNGQNEIRFRKAHSRFNLTNSIVIDGIFALKKIFWPVKAIKVRSAEKYFFHGQTFLS